MSLIRKLLSATAILAATAATPAFAATASYSSPVSAPPISISNLIEQSSNWPTATSVGTVTTISWDINYASSTYPIQVRVCTVKAGTTYCTGWSTTHTGTETGFSGYPAANPFFFQARVVTTPTTTGKVIKPTIYGSGNSFINVTYSY